MSNDIKSALLKDINTVNKYMLEQLDFWIQGKNYHVSKNGLCGIDVPGSVCVPDMSCCHENVNTSIEEKKKFKFAYLNGDQDILNQLIIGFLQNIFPEVTITNFEDLSIEDQAIVMSKINQDFNGMVN